MLEWQQLKDIDLEIWQLARELLGLIYNYFRDCKDFTFKNQIIAGLSIMKNIAEGFSRSSDKEFKQFLNISNQKSQTSCSI